MQAPATKGQQELPITQDTAQKTLSPAGRLLRRGNAVGALRALLPGSLFFLGIVLIVHILAYVAGRYAPDSNTRFLQVDRQHTARILAGADRIDALAVGNSHAGSLDMPALGFDNGYRYPRADGDLFETQYFLNHVVPRLSRLKVVLIPISYFSFQGDNAASTEVDIRRAHLYASLPTWSFMPGDVEPFLIGKSHTYFPITRLLREDNWEGVLLSLMGREAEQKGFVEVESGDCTSLNPDQLAASVENRVAKYMRLAREMNANHPGLAENAYAALAETIYDLRRRGVRVILFTPPYWQGYTESYMAQDPQTVLQMRSSMERLQQERGVEYYDFAQDPEFSANPALFMDSDHLNSCGAELFSAKLGAMISQPVVNQP